MNEEERVFFPGFRLLVLLCQVPLPRNAVDRLCHFIVALPVSFIYSFIVLFYSK